MEKEIKYETFNPMEEFKESIKKSLPTKEILKNSLSSLKEASLNSNPLLKNIDKIELSNSFKLFKLKAGDILFKEGDIDNNLYIIKSGHISIEKYTTIQKTNKKQLAILKRGDFLGEGSLNNSNPKEVNTICLKDSEILAIDSRKAFGRFIKEYPQEGLEILSYIIDITNKRLLEANKIISANHELTTAINSIEEFNYKSIFFILEKIKNIIDTDYILYFEKHKVLDDFLTLKYDTRKPGKIQDIVFEKKGDFLDLTEVYTKAGVDEKDYLVLNKVSIGKEILGFLILGRYKRIFMDNEKKLVSSSTTFLAGVIKQFIQRQEDRDKIYISEMSK